MPGTLKEPWGTLKGPSEPSSTLGNPKEPYNAQNITKLDSTKVTSRDASGFVMHLKIVNDLRDKSEGLLQKFVMICEISSNTLLICYKDK